MKQRNISYSPFSIKRAICATATKLGYVDPFAQGSGLLNVEKAFEHLLEHDKAVENMLRYVLFCSMLLFVRSFTTLFKFSIPCSGISCLFYKFFFCVVFYKVFFVLSSCAFLIMHYITNKSF